jgi:hypothetical protein
MNPVWREFEPTRRDAIALRKAIVLPKVFAGEMAEWLKAHAWKACLLERVTWVRIPLSPPAIFIAGKFRRRLPCNTRNMATFRDISQALLSTRWVEPAGGHICLLTESRSAQGVMAITRRGLPEPPTIFSGAAMTMAPVGGS